MMLNKYQEGERPKKIASWQVAHKMEHDRNFAKNQRKRNNLLDPEDDLKEKQNE